MGGIPDSNLTRAARYAVPFVLLSVPLWTTTINAVVHEPYLDEVFHVRQAQAYWAHKWSQWDPKITTPPGLYLWSYALCACILALRGSPTELSPDVLRSTNTAVGSMILPWRLQTLLDTLRKEQNKRPAGAWLSHTVLNICMFPPLFFFSGLYYTDVLALLTVVEAYNWDLGRAAGEKFASIGFLALGLAALALRQTNVFWAVAFIGGLQIVRSVRKVSKACESSKLTDIMREGMQNGLYDPFVSKASLADYFKTAASLVAVGLNNISTVIWPIIPHLFILCAFATFVIWNDGVVLGHKEFHTASLHIPQMLYIWPYFIFFSWPILLIPVLNLVVPSDFVPGFLDYSFPKRQKGLPRVSAVLIVISAMLAAVHFNTVVHPFTLADNRHYVFYVFRLLLGHYPATRYVAVIVYLFGCWSVIAAFGFSTTTPPPKLVQVPLTMAPPERRLGEGPKKDSKRPKRDRRSATAIKASRTSSLSAETFARVQEHISERHKRHQDPPRVSFVIIWLAATTMSLVTAPLVEPRYFIIPWVMWRLHLPPQPIPIMYRQNRPRGSKEVFWANLVTYSPLFLETLWFLVINAVTGYIFLYKGFEWPQEPGKTQRFMW